MTPEQFFTTFATMEGPVRMATILKSGGTGAGQPGNRLFVNAEGRVVGTVGGGPAEAEILEVCRELVSGFRIFEIGSSVLSPLGGCSDSLQVVVELVDLHDPAIGDFWRAVTGQIKTDEPLSLGSLYDPTTGNSAHLLEDEKGGNLSCGNVSLIQRLRDRSAPEADANQSLFIQPLNQGGRLLLFGAGHVARQTAAFAEWVGFRVRVIDPRAPLCNHDHFSEQCRLFVEAYEQFFGRERIREQDFVAILGPDHQTDFHLLQLAARTPARYIGLMGSSKKVRSFLNQLEKKGEADTLKDRLHAPIGIDIPSKSPSEVGIAIVAELIKERSDCQSIPN